MYERGYIKVNQQGVIEKGPRPAMTNHLTAFVEDLVGKDVSAFTEHTVKYFAWHRKWHNQKIQSPTPAHVQ
ncbi:hypothetical protein [Arthrobacter antibioticus]|uniref:hypothetical protein n=1 Tax=Arthrobacter sp. H35-MC1 TaxID=3046203 RepID=UPI0024BA4BCB|nr:hypothetical protein [Arthrobacter sp. H35-MC1]MDJ0318635.1 hypothetical protein [Arthrobacter sp. H35-MC1]